MQAAAAARAGVAAFQCGARVDGRLQGHIFHRVLDVQVLQFGDIEVGEVNVRLDQTGQNTAALRVDDLSGRLSGWRIGRRASIGDDAVLDEQGGIGNGRGSRAVNELAVADEGGAGGEFHGEKGRGCSRPRWGRGTKRPRPETLLG